MTRAAAIPAVLLPALEAAESRYRENGGSPERPPTAAAETLSRVWASSPFVATFVDVTGIVIYFSIARYFLSDYLG